MTNTTSSNEDEDWTGLTKEKISVTEIPEVEEKIKSKIISEFKEQMEIESAKQAHEQQIKCNNGKHVWMYSIFCDRCGEDFEEWQKQMPKKTAFDILADDLPHVLYAMADEGLIQKGDARKITRRMRRKAVDRGLLKHV
jgi:hypothetical protein